MNSNDDFTPNADPLNLTSTWFIKPGAEAAAWSAIKKMVERIKLEEPGTWSYVVNAPYADASSLQSLPPVVPTTVIFVETYRDVQAFKDHVNGPIFKGFLSEYGDLFLSSNGKPYTTVTFLTKQASFMRPIMVTES